MLPPQAEGKESPGEVAGCGAEFGALDLNHSRAPNRCINLVKSTNYNISRGRIIDIVQKRQYIAQTSAKVMGARTPSLYHFELRCTVLRSVHSMSLAFLSAT